MANRTYLYACDATPEQGSKQGIVGITEWSYRIPLLSKVLLSGGPQLSRSLIWDNPHKIAITGDYESGVEHFAKVLSKIEREDAQPMIQEAMNFLGDAQNQRKYFILECGEIFDMNSEPLDVQSSNLRDEILNIDSEVSTALQAVNSPQRPSQSILSKLFKPSPPESADLQPLYDIGLGHWSNVLYFHFE